MELLEIAKKRHSVRKYTGKEIEQEKLDIFLAAPTGRAAKRMTEATGYEARTIHRMLELSGALSGGDRKAGFERNEDNPLEADVVIICLLYTSPSPRDS